MRRRTLLVALMTTVGGLTATTIASAHPNPANCTTNGLSLTLDRSSQVVRNGDVITYGLSVDNTIAGAVPCDISSAAVDLYLPSPAGPASTTPIRVQQGANYASGFPFTRIAAQQYTVAANPGVTNLEVRALASGTLHSNSMDTNFANIEKTLGTDVTWPALTLTKTGSTSGGQSPQTVTYTYAVTNTSQTPVPMDQVSVADNLCTAVSGPAGDNGDGLLTNGETWNFTCTTTHTQPGTHVNTATASGRSTVDTRPVTSPPASWTVTVTPSPTQIAAACTLSTPSALRVRARERTTIRVRVGTAGAGTQVRITLPGGSVVRKTTNSSGVAIFRVRPARSGTLTIRAANCGDVDRLTVRAPRRTITRRVPRVTG